MFIFEDCFSRISAKLKEWLYMIPDPLKWYSKCWPKPTENLKDKVKLCELCYPNNDPNEFEIPDDLRNLELNKDLYVYDVKLFNIHPAKWKIVGRNILNMAYEDPQYGQMPEDDPDEMDPLPPPTEPSDYLKSLTEPVINVNLKGLRVVELESLGDMFYEIADYLEMDRDGGPEVTEPQLEEPEGELDFLKQVNFCPYEAIGREVKVKKTITNSDVIPGIPKTHFRTDHDDWIDCVTKHEYKAEPPGPPVTSEDGITYEPWSETDVTRDLYLEGEPL